MLYGNWPQSYDEVVLVLNQDNGVSAETLYQLGFITQSQYEAAEEKIEQGEAADEIRFSYADICNHTLYLVPACDHYIENENGTFTYLEDTTLEEEKLLENAVELKISGIVRPNDASSNASISTAVGYTSGLTDYVITRSNESACLLYTSSAMPVRYASPCWRCAEHSRFFLEMPFVMSKLMIVKAKNTTVRIQL